MKYICTVDDNGIYEIFTFPNVINHDAMAEVLAHIKNQTFGNWERLHREPVSAGFVSEGGHCHGESESLGLSSRLEDTSVLELQFK